MTERARLPNRRAAQIAMFEHDGRRYRATFGTFGDGKLGEIFIDTGKANSALQQHSDDAAELVSLLLQHGVTPKTIKQSISGPIRTALDIWIGGAS
jgi:hypothetical protein